MAFQDGEQVGAYRIIEQLGRGGMATVYKAYHANLDRYVALKVLHPAFMQDSNFLARFEREAKVVARLEHPNIIPVYDFADHEGSPYLVMKYIEGETLKARIIGGKITPEYGVDVIEAVGKGLSYAHKQDILHRDIKPSNVVISNNDEIYLADFGLARIATAGESTMSGDMMLGTPQYISPEQAIGKRELDEGTDIYSFGVMIYELVVGRVPFISDTPFAIVHDHIYKPLPLPRATNPNVPESVERVLLKALAKERSDRFESVDDLVKAFKSAVQGETMPDEWAVTEMAGGQSTMQVAGSTQMPQQPLTPTPTPAPAYDILPEKKKKRFTWKRLGLGALGVFVFCFCSMVVINALDGEANQPDQNNNANLNIDNDADIKNENDVSDQEELNAELERDYAIEQAEAAVAKNPENPIALLELAITLYDAGFAEDASETFIAAQELAGEDPEFYMLAGDMLAAREAWLLALQQYVQVIDLGYESDSNRLAAKLTKTLYHASTDPEVKEMLFGKTEEDSINKSMLIASRARYTLVVEENIGRATEIFDRIAESDRLDSSYAKLVEAELMIAFEEYEIAATLLEELLKPNSGSMEWIRVEARRMLTELP